MGRFAELVVDRDLVDRAVEAGGSMPPIPSRLTSGVSDIVGEHGAQPLQLELARAIVHLADHVVDRRPGP